MRCGSRLTEQELYRARRDLRKAGQISAPLARELAQVAGFLVWRGHLPGSYAPYGEWNKEAEAEVLQDWLAERLLSDGGLLALLDQARGVSSFRRLAEISLRQFVLNRSQRSQSKNLYARMLEMLREEDGFVVERDAARAHDIVWTLSSQPARAAFDGSDEHLLSLAFSLGDFELIRYKASAAKLSPLLSSEELRRFVIGMLEAGGPMTLTALSKALALRFDLSEADFDSLQAEQPPLVRSGERIERDVISRASAMTVIAELSQRQSVILLATRAEVTMQVLATELGCSLGTIANEQRRVGDLVKRHCDDGPEAVELLKIVGDLLYEHSGDE